MEIRCPQCGTEQPPGEEWQQKLCPACLMRLGLSGAIPANPLPEAQPQLEPASATETKSTKTPRRRVLPIPWDWRWAAFIAGGAIVLSLVLVAVRHFTETSAPLPVVRFDIDTPDDMELQDFAVSPDGRQLAYTAGSGEENTLLWVRPLDQLEAHELRGTEGATMPFWSPDTQWIGFFTEDKLKTIRVHGGSPPMTIAIVSQPRGGAWGMDGSILFASDSGGLHRVPSTGGESSPIASTRRDRGYLHFESPQFFPDGVHFLFTSLGPESARQIHIGRLDSGETRTLAVDASGGIYANGRILFVRQGILLVQPLDIGRMERTGDPVSIPYAEAIRSSDNQMPSYSVGGNVLAYRSGGSPVAKELLWMDRFGKVIQAAAESAVASSFALSPDSARVAITRTSPGDNASELWLLDLARGTATRLTFDGQGAANPLWAPDGRHVAFTSGVEAQTEVRSTAMDGSSTMERLLKLPLDSVLDSWSPDGRFLAYTAPERGKLMLWTLQLEGDRKPMPLLNGNFNYRQARFSPDGRFVAYVSDESGRDEVYLRSFPSGEVRLLVSVNGGTQPSWRRDGRELFYLSPARQLTSIAIEGSRERAPGLGIPRPLFQLPRHASGYEVANDGQRFLVAVPLQEQQRSPLHLVLNWAHEK